MRTPIALTAEAAREVERENAAIARGLKQHDPELLDQLIETYQHRLMWYLIFLTSKREVSRKRTMASLDEMREGGEGERPFEIVQEGPSPLEQFEGRENASEVATVLQTLEPAYREVLTLRFHEELSLEEIATVTRAPLSTVKSRLYRGLAALKPELLKLRAGGGRGSDDGKMEMRS